MLYLASILRNAGHEPTFIDADVDDLHEGHVAYKVAIADLVGITMVSLQASAGYRLVDFLKFAHPDLPIVVGGSHPSGMRQRIFKDCQSIDYVVYGEGEHTLLELVKALKTNPI